MKNLLSIIKKRILRKPKIRISDFKIPEPTLKVVDLTDEEGGRIAENLNKYQKLLIWMEENSDEIFAKSPNNEIYAVGIYKDPPTKPEIHYFNSKYTKKSLIDRLFRKTILIGTLDFMIESNKKGEVNAFIYKYQNDVEMLLAYG